MSRPGLLTSTELAHELGYADRSALHYRIDGGDVRLAACRIPGRNHRCWSRSRLEAAGFLTAERPAASMPITAGLCASATIAWRIA